MQIHDLSGSIGRDLYGKIKCQHCGAVEKLSGGYDDHYWHNSVLPAMHCKSCGKNSAGEMAENHTPDTPEFAEVEVKKPTTVQIEIKGWIFAKPSWGARRLNYEFSQHDYEEWAKSPDIDRDGSWKQYRKISAHVITVEVPELDPKQIAIEALESQKTSLRAELGKRIAEIEDQISKLTAIEYTPPSADEECDIPF